MMYIKKNIIWIILLLLLLMTSCQRTPQPVSPVIAKVGNEVLTMAEINRMTPPNLTAAARKNFQLHYVDNWIKRSVCSGTKNYLRFSDYATSGKL